MKNLNLIVLISIFVALQSVSLSAQNWSLGPIAGLNITKISGDGNDDLKYKPGFVGGVVINYSNVSHMGISANILFSQYGAENEGRDSKLTLNYLQLPIYGVYYFGAQADHFRPKIYAGPYVSFLMSAKDGNDVDVNPDDAFFNNIDGGLVGGLGFNYRLVRGIWLNMDVRYTVGLSDIDKTELTKSYNQGAGIMLGVAFALTPDEY